MGFDIKALDLKYSLPINYLNAFGQISPSLKPEYYYYLLQEFLQRFNETIYVTPLPLAGSFFTTRLFLIHTVSSPREFILSDILCSSSPAHST